MDEISKIANSLDRFEAAVRQLETTLADVHKQSGDLDASKGEISALQAEREKLAEELSAVRTRADELSEANRQAARRIDVAMGRIKNVTG